MKTATKNLLVKILGLLIAMIPLLFYDSLILKEPISEGIIVSRSIFWAVLVIASWRVLRAIQLFSAKYEDEEGHPFLS